MFKRICLGVFASLIIFIGILHLVAPYVMGNDNSAESFFEPLNLAYSESFTAIGEVNLHAITVGDSSLRSLILFIHGTPGSWMDFREYLADSLLRNRFRMIALDRPGQGLSNYGESMVSISDQVSHI
ncbi:MAG: pimeloyl-ACP methyl ester carboxylesterase [Saprospiraceae bacterium]|jgi:pimeloyl-ACP methyl ester carboxylesterase